MPGPSSPKRKAKEQQAKQAKQRDAEAKARAKAEREPIRDFRLPANYSPDPDSVIHSISFDSLTQEGKEWWDEWGGKGGEFETRQGNKGDRQGAMGWVRAKYVIEWWPEFFPQATNASELDRTWFFETSRMGRRIYAYLDNWHKRHPEEEEKPTKSKSVVKRKTKAYGHDYWRRANLEIYEEAIRLWKEEHERNPNFGEVRSVSSQEFKKLPLEEQKKWRAKAKDALAASRAQAKITDPAERKKYIDDLLTRLHEITEEAEDIAGVQMLTLVVYEKEDGKFHIGREVSEGLRGFGKTEVVGHTMTALQGHIQKSVGLGVVNPFPKPATYPDYANGNMPRIPSYMGWGVDECRKLHREYVKSTAVFQGFSVSARFNWSELKANLEYFFDLKRLPCSEFDDPSHLPMPILLLYLQFFTACQTGKVPEDMTFQFFRILAGSGLVIHPSESQETDREVVMRGGKEVVVLVFKNRVTKCHQPDGKMRFEQAGTDYADFLALGMAHAHATAAPPQSWLQLPSAGPTIPKAVIFGNELERLNIWADRLPEASKNRVIRLIEATNEHQAHIPATHPKGVYLRRGPIPLIIPPSVLEWRVSETTWGPSCYFQPSAREEGTLYYFEVYQQELRETDVIRHKPSQSYFGGETGIVRVVRALIQLYLNSCAVRGDLTPEPPEDPPADFDLTRFPVGEHDRIASWIDAWTLSITEDIEILRKSFPEREKGLAEVPQGRASSHEPTDDAPSAPATSGLNSAAHEASIPRDAPAKRAPRSRKHTSTAVNDEGTSDEEMDDEEIDFEELDVTAQDDDTSEDEALRPHKHDLPDSIYPQGDELGLRARYRFSPTVPEMIIYGIGDQSLKPWIRVSSVFVDPPRLPEYVAPCLTRPGSFLRMLLALESEARKAREAWNHFTDENPRYTDEILREVEEYAEECEEDLRPLLSIRYLRQLVWMRAGAMAPTVFAHWRSMMYILREGAALFATLDNMLEREAFDDPETTALVLNEAVQKAKQQTIYLECYCYELQRYQELATKHYNRAKGAWSAGRDPNAVRELAAIGQSISDWIDDTTKVSRELKVNRFKLWKDVLGEEYKPTPNVVYLFGCPARSERVKGLAESIARAAGDETCWDDVESAPPAGTTSDKLPPAASRASTPPTNPLDQTVNPPRKRPTPKSMPIPDADIPLEDSTSPFEPALTGESAPTDKPIVTDREPPPDPLPPAVEVPEITISADEPAGMDTTSGLDTDMDLDGMGKDKGLNERDGEERRTEERSSEAPSLSSLQVVRTPALSTSEVSTDSLTPGSTPAKDKKRKRTFDEPPPPGTRKSARVDALKALEDLPQMERTRGATKRAAANAPKVDSQSSRSRRK